MTFSRIRSTDRGRVAKYTESTSVIHGDGWASAGLLSSTPLFMEGSYQIVKTFTEGTAKAQLGEDIFQASDDGSYFIAHEIGFTLGFCPIMWLRLSEMDSIIRVLQQARDLADQRVTRFYSEDVEVSPQTI